jgi:two-component system chemotaxis response regulator CheY
MAKTILIVDDSASLRRVVQIALTGVGYEVIEALDGKDALTKLGKLAGKKIHLIITDVNMPNMNGIEFVTLLKKDPAYKFTPVIMLTTESEDAIKQEGRAAGAKAWIVKPFNPAQMINAVSKLILP